MSVVLTEELKPGDLVYLKSGSPKMVVVKIEGNFATVYWSAYGSHSIDTKEIPLVALVKKTF